MAGLAIIHCSGVANHMHLGLLLHIVILMVISRFICPQCSERRFVADLRLQRLQEFCSWNFVMACKVSALFVRDTRLLNVMKCCYDPDRAVL
jgi:hypothetical protein